MTPITRDRIIRTSLKAIVQGEGEIGARVSAVAEQLEKIPATDRRIIAKALKARLLRALRQTKATIASASPLNSATKKQLEALSAKEGMLFHEEKPNPALISGFTIQMGDNRLDYSLLARLTQLSV